MVALKKHYKAQQKRTKRYVTCMNKLYCFGMSDYDKIFFLDGDMIFLQNCDELFNFDSLSFARTIPNNPESLIATIFGCKPKKNFAYAFLNASCLFCVGAMAIVGSFKAGIEQGYFRPELNYNVLSKIMRLSAKYVVEHEDISQYDCDFIFKNVIFVFFRGFCTIKGIEAVDKKFT